MVPDRTLVDRFRADLDALIEPRLRFGVAVSGGADSLALLLLAAAAKPGLVEAATVDHGLRAESRDEAEMVAGLCQRLGVPHTTLAVHWDLPPSTAIQEQARTVRYGALAEWMLQHELRALLTAHHLDDQAETLIMRLNRGSGVRGLAGMRRAAPVPGSPEQSLLRPLLSWRRSELDSICAEAGVSPVSDPSNKDTRFERIRIRNQLAEADWLDAEAVARSADYLALADEALDWATGIEWDSRVEVTGDRIVYRPSSAPSEIRRRIVARIMSKIGTEGLSNELRRREIDRLIGDLEADRTTTLRGLRCSGGSDWTFSRARPRRKNG
jgi:tRNA(Ile)-lysidine synthase